MNISHALLVSLVLFLSGSSMVHASFVPLVCDGTLVFKDSSITCQKNQWDFATPPEIYSECAFSAITSDKKTDDVITICPAKGLSIFRPYYLVKQNNPQGENQTGFPTLTLENQGFALAPIETLSIFLIIASILILRYLGYNFSFLKYETSRDRVPYIIFRAIFVFLVSFVLIMHIIQPTDEIMLWIFLTALIITIHNTWKSWKVHTALLLKEKEVEEKLANI